MIMASGPISSVQIIWQVGLAICVLLWESLLLKLEVRWSASCLKHLNKTSGLLPCPSEAIGGLHDFPFSLIGFLDGQE